MKKIIFSSFSLGLIISCNSPQKNQVFEENSIWQRDFYLAPELKHHVEYQLGSDSLSYAIEGDAVNMAYQMKVDTIVSQDKRIIAFDNRGKCYVLFIKDLGGDSIKIFKEEKKDRTEALSFPIPAPDYKDNHNQGWNTYYKKKEEKD